MVRGTTPESNLVIVLNCHEELKAWMEYARASVGKPTEARAAGAAGAARAVTNHRTKNPLPSLPSPLPPPMSFFLDVAPHDDRDVVAASVVERVLQQIVAHLFGGGHAAEPFGDAVVRHVFGEAVAA